MFFRDFHPPSSKLRLAFFYKKKQSSTRSGRCVSASGGTTTVFYPGWRYSRKILLDTGKGGFYRMLTLISLNSENFTYAQLKVNKADLMFTKADNTSLPYEIERTGI
jgi:hypothetical protein